MNGLKTRYPRYSNETSQMLLFHVIISTLLFPRYYFHTILRNRELRISVQHSIPSFIKMNVIVLNIKFRDLKLTEHIIHLS